MFEFEFVSVLLKGICFVSQQVDGYLLGSKKSTTQKKQCFVFASFTINLFELII